MGGLSWASGSCRAGGTWGSCRRCRVRGGRSRGCTRSSGDGRSRTCACSLRSDDEGEVVAHGEATVTDGDESGFGWVVEEVGEEAEEVGEMEVHVGSQKRR